MLNRSFYQLLSGLFSHDRLQPGERVERLLKDSAMSENIHQDQSGAEMIEPHAGQDFLVVGIGASAGGIQALREFFARVPAESGMAYVVILHLSPDHDSQLAAVLQSTTPMPVTQVAQRAACTVLHRMEQRFAVWLLLLTDRLDADTIETTQERIAHHLGVRRAGVTELAGELQRQGAINYTRGNFRVVNRSLLEMIACECYGAMTDARRESIYR
jgi:CheB methylesterase/Crp-like helix-turn-helix domain